MNIVFHPQWENPRMYLQGRQTYGDIIKLYHKSGNIFLITLNIDQEANMKTIVQKSTEY